MSKRIRYVKEALLARKEELLKELKYYEKRIDVARSKTNNSFYDESSDSEQEFTVELEPSVSELKLKQSMLQTCLFATQELTGVQILQSEVNIMVNDPVFEKEPPVKEAGVWKEVTAECRVDLVPFSMTFYVHHPKRSFGSQQYRCLRITPVKAAHEQELALSVLSTVKTPSDAVEVLRSYARAHRSRRSSLARLAEKYSDTLFMEPMPEGGYILKCANLLEVSWTLQNKGSPITPFHHRMKFDLEHMDESYIKIITQAHRQLSDPAVETDERTLLLAKIINTCLQARKDMPMNESESDTEKLTDVNSETKVKDSEIMAPPKTIPKKVKSVKRRNEDGGGTSKKAKIDNKENVTDNNRGRDDLNLMIESDLKSKNNVNEIDKQIKKTINSKNDGNTKGSSGHKISNANSNVAPKSNIDSNRTEAKDGNTDTRNKGDGKDLNTEKVIKKSKINTKTVSKEAKDNLVEETKSTKNTNSKDQTNDAKTENKNSVANSKNEKNKKAKSTKDTTEVTNDVNSKSESVSSKNVENNNKNKDGSRKMDKNEITNEANNKDNNNKNANKKGTKEIANDKNSKSEMATSKNNKNNLNNKDDNNKMDKNEITSEANSKTENKNLKNKNAKINKGTIKATNDINSKAETVNSKNDENNLKNKIASNKKDTNTLTNEPNTKSENKSSKMNKDNLKNKNINNKGSKNVNDINSKSEKNVKSLNSVDKEDTTATNKNKIVAKSKAINNVVSKNTDNNVINNNLTSTKSNDKNDLNKNEKNLKTKLNPENVVASKKSKTELKNDKNYEKLQKISTKVDVNKKDSTTNIEKMKTQSLMQRFSKPISVANKANIASNKKIISPKIMKNKTNINTKIGVMKNILSVSKQSDKNSSKIPQRIKSSDIKKNILRLSPRFIKKPSVIPKI